MLAKHFQFLSEMDTSNVRIYRAGPLRKPNFKTNKPGTAQVGGISKAEKQQKDFRVSSILFYSTRMRKKLKKQFRIFFEYFWSPVSRIVPKNVKGVPLEVFEHPFFSKIEKK